VLEQYTGGTFESENQKLNVLDYNTFLAIAALFSQDEAVLKTDAMLKNNEMNIQNEGFNTTISDEQVADFADTVKMSGDDLNNTGEPTSEIEIVRN
jgi:hypothetical protein